MSLTSMQLSKLLFKPPMPASTVTKRPQQTLRSVDAKGQLTIKVNNILPAEPIKQFHMLGSTVQ